MKEYREFLYLTLSNVASSKFEEVKITLGKTALYKRKDFHDLLYPIYINCDYPIHQTAKSLVHLELF